MGIKNYSLQLKIISNGNEECRKLRNYAEKINKLIPEIETYWVGGNDRYQIATAIQDCFKEAVRIANNYCSVCHNSKRWLNEINKLDKISSKYVAVSVGAVTPCVLNPSTNVNIKIDTARIRNCSTIILQLGRSLESIYSRTSEIFNGLDSLILKRIPGIKHSICGQILELKQKNDRIAGNMKRICELYEATEQEICRMIESYSSSEFESGKVKSQIQKNKEHNKSEKSAQSKTNATAVSIEKAIENSETAKQILKDMTKDNAIAKIEEIRKKLEKGEYGTVIGDIWDEYAVGEMYDKSTGSFSTTALKLKSLKYFAEMGDGCFYEKGRFSYLWDNLHKYESAVGYHQFRTAGVSIVAGAVQTVGKGLVDVSCRLINDAIHATPVGKILDYGNAITKDITGTNPAQEFNKISNKISDAVDDFFDNEIEQAQFKDNLRIQGKNLQEKASSGNYVGCGSGGGDGESW